MKYLFLFILSISFLFQSCSDGLELESSDADQVVKEDTNKETEAYAEDSSTKNDTNQSTEDLDALLDESLDDMVDELAVSDEEKTFLKTFIDSIKQQLNLDDSSIINSILQGSLDELGINNEDVQKLLFDLVLKSVTPIEVTIFLEILKSLDLNLGDGSSGLDLSKIASLLISKSLKAFVDGGFFSGDKLEILSKITEFLSKISSNN